MSQAFGGDSNSKIYQIVSPIESHDHHHQTSGWTNATLKSLKHRSRDNKPNDRRCANLITKAWLLEWLSWLLAAGSIGGIAAVLVKFDGRSLPEWPYGITLGALVSLLATIATIGLAEPIAAGIGQAKWTWHTKQRRMADFDLIDEASRGPLKAGWLICRGKGGIIAICGAMLAIIVFGVNPFVQQVIHTSLSVVQSPEAAAVPVTTGYNPDGSAAEDFDPQLSQKAALQRGLIDINANSSTFFVSPRCSTGNCTWPTYTTLGVCSRCTDLSMHLTTSTDPETELTITTLPNNVSITWQNGTTVEGLIAMTVQVSNGMSNSLLDSIAYPESTNASAEVFPLADIFAIIAPYATTNIAADLQGPYASECLIQLCVQNFSSTSVNGIFLEHSVGNDPVYINDTFSVELLSMNGVNYTYEWNAAKGLMNYFADIFNSTVQQENSASPISEWPENGVAQSIFHWTNGTTEHIPTKLFDNIASSMTQNLRQLSDRTAPGEAHTWQTIVVVRWPWMTLPFAMLALVALYLLVVMMASARSQLEPWKTSSLPILMHGLIDDESRGLISGCATLTEMEHTADQLYMKTVMTGQMGGRAGVENLGLRVTEQPEGSGDGDVPELSYAYQMTTSEEDSTNGRAW